MSVTDQRISYLSGHEGETILVMTDFVTIKFRGEDGDGIFVLAEVVSPPQGGPPMLHRHKDEETFYVLDGLFRFDTLQENHLDSITTTPGSVIHIPSMVWHNYKNIGATPGKLLVVLQPGDMVDFFRELGVAVMDKTNFPRPAGPPDMQRVMAITKKYHVEMMEPPSQH
jgi:quercetin dioxygenase-like cupin family protein